jgi:hypothetical protein
MSRIPVVQAGAHTAFEWAGIRHLPGTLMLPRRWPGAGDCGSQIQFLGFFWDDIDSWTAIFLHNPGIGLTYLPGHGGRNVSS